jgi:hypothetical protein
MLQSRLRADVRVYMDAVQVLEVAALAIGSNPNFKKALHDVHVSREAFIEARTKLNEHITAHGCG